MSEKTIVLTGGGTAGHCLPCIALLPTIKKYFRKIYYVGREEGIEKRLAEEAGVEYYGVPCVKLERKLTLKNLGIPFTLLKGISEAKKLLEKLKPDVVFSKGGYVALPVALAAEKLNIPTVLHESDMSLGLANKLAVKKATALLCGFKPLSYEYPRAVFTGNPIREELLKKRDNKAIIRGFGFNEAKPVLLVFGGSQGAEAINEIVIKTIDDLLKNFSVLHLTGKNKRTNIKKDGYYEAEYLSDMGAAFSVADVCVSRAGANALNELIALKIPTLAIPLPKGNSRGDQEQNADYYRRYGAIRTLSEPEMTKDVFIKEIFATYASAEQLKRNAEKCLSPNANERIAEEIVKASL